jgi:hypothetical protein
LGDVEEVLAMIVSANNISMPLIAPSVNVQTEQTARENRAREPVTPTTQTHKPNAERRVKPDDKRRRNAAWDPAEHPEYDVGTDAEMETSQHQPIKSELERLFDLLALSYYSENQGKGYTMRFRLPKHIIDEAINEGRMARRRTVIKYHYGQAVAPHTPSEVLAIL